MKSARETSHPIDQLEPVPSRGLLAPAELEAMRLCDVERCDQEAAGRRMRVSRGTVQRLLRSGRAKVIRALLESQALVIEEGAEHEALYSDRQRRS